MKISLRLGLLLIGLGLATLLSGCPGMTGPQSAAQQMPPGMLPPPGLKSGGVRTLMATTITPPDNQMIMVRTTRVLSGALEERRGAPTPPSADLTQWNSVRRITFADSVALLEGLNFDGRAADQPKDVNLSLPLGFTQLEWKYETAPAGFNPAPAGAGAQPPAQAPAKAPTTAPAKAPANAPASKAPESKSGK